MLVVTKPPTREPSKHSNAPPRPNPPSQPPPRPTPPPRPVSPVAGSCEDHDGDQVLQSSKALPDITQNQEFDLLNLSNNGPQNTANVPKESSFDLLGSFEAQSNNTMPDLLNNSQAKLPGLDDIFSSFNTTQQPNPNANLPDLNNVNFNAFGQDNRPPAEPNVDPFDLAANLDYNSRNVPLFPTSKDTSPQQSGPQPAESSKDPFANIGNLASGFNLNWSGPPPTVKASPINSAHSTQASSPVHQFGGFVTSPHLSASTSPRGPSTPTHPTQQAPGARPDYSRSNFEPKTKQNAAANGAGTATAGTDDIFADILGQQGYNFANKSNQGPRSINAMRKEELVKDMDPDKLKILEWV